MIQASGSPVRRRWRNESSSAGSPAARANNSEASSRAATKPALESVAASTSRSSPFDTLDIGPREQGLRAYVNRLATSPAPAQATTVVTTPTLNRQTVRNAAAASGITSQSG